MRLAGGLTFSTLLFAGIYLGCSTAQAGPTMPPQWERVVSHSRHIQGPTTIRAINSFVNQFPYIHDPRNEWLLPHQFFARGGDCEDYAIAKYLLLRQAGHRPRLVAMRGHMVVIVNGQVLDNREPNPYPVSRLRGVVYYLDEQGIHFN